MKDFVGLPNFSSSLTPHTSVFRGLAVFSIQYSKSHLKTCIKSGPLLYPDLVVPLRFWHSEWQTCKPVSSSVLFFSIYCGHTGTSRVFSAHSLCLEVSPSRHHRVNPPPNIITLINCPFLKWAPVISHSRLLQFPVLPIFLYFRVQPKAKENSQTTRELLQLWNLPTEKRASSHLILPYIPL